ncbi:hypothetical protein GCM10010421_48240 [Streptomyces glaucus]|uniref:Secreted protein n=1 Tax=Streptomyces glaucus TaxID=284029 RepID=A0ABN3K5M0_9ACTN
MPSCLPRSPPVTVGAADHASVAPLVPAAGRRSAARRPYGIPATAADGSGRDRAEPAGSVVRPPRTVRAAVPDTAGWAIAPAARRRAAGLLEHPGNEQVTT